jgi:hypothetical protein
MNEKSSRLSYANVMSSIAVFLVLGGGTAFAATKLAANSVGPKQLKRNAVTGAKVRNRSLTGADIKPGTLGAVPSASSAASLVGQTSFSIRLGFGQAQTIATNGAVSFAAECLQEGTTFQIVRIVAATTADEAVMAGDDNFEATEPIDFLNTDTPAEDRQLAAKGATSGKTVVTNDIDKGFVLGPEGKGLTANTEGIVLGLNYGQPGCLVAGVINAVG